MKESKCSHHGLITVKTQHQPAETKLATGKLISKPTTSQFTSKERNNRVGSIKQNIADGKLFGIALIGL